MSIISGYFLALLMGLTLGLIGAGGSILTVPILVYFLGIKPVIATGYSLIVVGFTALVGSISYWRKGYVSIKEAIIFAIPAMLSVWLTRALIIPSIPENIGAYSKGDFIMICFGLLMITASLFIFRSPSLNELHSPQAFTFWKYFKSITGGIAVGITTGMVGAGGGFLIVPSLIALFNFPMKQAIGTSLIIIAINSLFGVSGDFVHGFHADWLFLILFLSMTLSGVLLGTHLGQKINGQKLKSYFAMFTLLIGILIILHELKLIF